MRPTKKTVSSSTALLLLWASLPLITSVNWLIRYESLKNTCPTTNPGYVEIDGIALNTCLNYGGNGYTSKYSCDLSTKMSIQTVYHSTNCNTSTYAFTNNYPLDQCTPYEENGAPLYYYGYTCATEPFSNFTQPYVVDA